MASTASVALPGSHAPAAGFDEPFEMLAGCHERVRRSLALLRRLVEHVSIAGIDSPGRQAAHDVWRYFAIAAPHHHEDEERHVIPRLLASGDAALEQAARTMRDDHARMHAAWQVLGPQLQALSRRADGPMTADEVAGLRQRVAEFAAMYDTHIPLEDGLAFPAARQRSSATDLTTMGAEMATRRGVVPAPAR